MKLNALIIGLGRIGMGFDLKSPKGYILTHTKAYLNNTNINLIGGVDIDREKRRVFERFSGKGSWGSLKEFLRENKGKIDIVSLCTPDNVRLAEIKKIVRLNPGLVIIEKPIALSLAEGRKIAKLLGDRKIKACVNYMRRSDPLYGKLKSDILARRFGLPFSVRVDYTGGLYKNGSHFLDLVLYCFGLPQKIKVIRKEKRGNGDIDASFVLFYKDFEVFFKGLPDRGYSAFEMDIFFSKGRVVISEDGVKCQVSIYAAKKDPVLSGFSFLKKEKRNFAGSRLQRYQANVILAAVEALRRNKPLASSAESALDTLSVCERIRDGS